MKLVNFIKPIAIAGLLALGVFACQEPGQEVLETKQEQTLAQKTQSNARAIEAGGAIIEEESIVVDVIGYNNRSQKCGGDEGICQISAEELIRDQSKLNSIGNLNPTTGGGLALTLTNPSAGFVQNLLQEGAFVQHHDFVFNTELVNQAFEQAGQENPQEEWIIPAGEYEITEYSPEEYEAVEADLIEQALTRPIIIVVRTEKAIYIIIL